MEQDIPTNYEEAMVDLSTRNDWIIQSYIELYLRLLESYRVKRLLVILNNYKAIRKKCKDQRQASRSICHKECFWQIQKGWLQYVAMLESIGYSLRSKMLSIPWLPQILYLKKYCNWYNKKVLENIWILVSRNLNSRFDRMIKGFWTWPKYRENVH